MMKFTNKSVTASKEILANDHYVAINYDLTGKNSLATDNIIPAGTIVPSNDSSAIGVLLNDVNLNENPNGAVVIHGFVQKSKLPVVPSQEAITALTNLGVRVMDNEA